VKRGQENSNAGKGKKAMRKKSERRVGIEDRGS
jgi:hypothetical protein